MTRILKSKFTRHITHIKVLYACSISKKYVMKVKVINGIFLLEFIIIYEDKYE